MFRYAKTLVAGENKRAPGYAAADATAQRAA